MSETCPLCGGTEKYYDKCRRCLLTIEVIFNSQEDDTIMSVKKARERVLHLEKNTDLYRERVP